MDELISKLEKQRIRNGEMSSPTTGKFSDLIKSKSTSDENVCSLPTRQTKISCRSLQEEFVDAENISPNSPGSSRKQRLRKPIQSDLFVDTTSHQMLKCSLCSEQFKCFDSEDANRTPKLLECLHYFCKGCIVEQARLNDWKSVQCPVCVLETTVFDKDLDSLKSNYSVDNLLKLCTYEMKTAAAKISTEKFLCGLCEEDNVLDAAWGCKDCNDEHGIIGLPLCTDCKINHSKSRAFKMHNLISIDEFGLFRKTKTGAQPKCSQHASKYLEFYCEGCDEIICPQCVTLDHVGHRFVLLQDLAVMKRNDLTAMCDEVSQHMEAFENVRCKVNNMIGEYKVKKSQMHDTIEIISRDLTEQVEARKARAHEEVDQAIAQTTKRLEAHEDFLAVATASMKATMSTIEAAIQEYPDYDICTSYDALNDGLRQASARPREIIAGCTDIPALSCTFEVEPIEAAGECLNKLFYRTKIVNGGTADLCDTGDVSTFADVNGFRQLTWVGQGQAVNAVDVDLFETEEAAFACVVDSNSHCVRVYDALYGNFVRVIGLGRGHKPGQLQSPAGIVLATGAGGAHELYVVDSGNHRIQCFNGLTGVYLRTIGSGRGSGRGQMCQPRFAATTASSQSGGPATTETLLFVADTGNHRIQVYHARTGTYVRTIGSGPGPGMGQLDAPLGVAFLPPCSQSGGKGLLFVADYGNNRIQVFDASTGAFIRSLSNSELDGPVGISVQRRIIPSPAPSVTDDSSASEEGGLQEDSSHNSDITPARSFDAVSKNPSHSIEEVLMFVSERNSTVVRALDHVTGEAMALVSISDRALALTTVTSVDTEEAAVSATSASETTVASVAVTIVANSIDEFETDTSAGRHPLVSMADNPAAVDVAEGVQDNAATVHVETDEQNNEAVDEEEKNNIEPPSTQPQVPSIRIEHPRGLSLHQAGGGKSLLFVADKHSGGVCVIAV